MFRRVLVALILIVSAAKGLGIDSNLVLAYTKAKHVKFGTVFTCGNKPGNLCYTKAHAEFLQNFKAKTDDFLENFKLFKTLSKSNLKFLIAAIDKKPFSRIGEVLERDVHGHFVAILDGNCANSAEIINQIQDFHYFHEFYHWLILASNKTVQVLLAALEKAPLNVNSDVNVAVFENNGTYTILDVYNQASERNGSFKVTRFGHYKRNDEIYNARFAGSKYWIRKNMTGVHFVGGIVQSDGTISREEYLASSRVKNSNSMHMFQWSTYKHCMDMYNFSFKSIVTTNSWGYVQKTGKFNGLVGLIQRHEVDVAMSPLVYKHDRMPVVGYVYGGWVLRSAFIYRRPKREAKSYEIFLRPLENNVWICTCLMMAFMMVMLKIMFSRENRILGNAMTHNSVDSSWSFLVLFTLGAFCQQGATCYPQLFSSRTLSIFVFLFCILTYQFYSASIVSYLLADPPRQINNLKDLLDSSLKAGNEEILIDRSYYVQTTDPVAIELYSRKIKNSNNNSGFFQALEGMALVKAGGFALHIETTNAYPIIEKTFSNHEICQLEEVQMYRTQQMHSGVQKRSPFREMFNYCLLRIEEDGLGYRLRKLWDTARPICIESADKKAIHVSLHEFSIGLIVLAYGIFWALVFFLWEIADHKLNVIVEVVKKKLTIIVNNSRLPQHPVAPFSH